jgi:hypothetical protein
MDLSVSSKRRRLIPSLVVAFAVVALLAVPFVRELGLRAAGWALVVNEPVAPADIIVVSLDSSGAGALSNYTNLLCSQSSPAILRVMSRMTRPR